MLIEQGLVEYLENAKNPEPMPGGGSVAAYVGALGSALTIMVGNLSYDKKSFTEEMTEAEQKEMKDNHARYNEIIEELKGLVDEDANSFDAVLEAFKLPRDTDEEKAARTKAIQDGYIHALEVPLQISRLCHEGLGLLKIFSEKGNQYAVSDAGCGALMLAAGGEASLFNVYVNALSLNDEEKRKEYQIEANRLKKEIRDMRNENLEIIYGERFGIEG